MEFRPILATPVPYGRDELEEDDNDEEFDDSSSNASCYSDMELMIAAEQEADPVTLDPPGASIPITIPFGPPYPNYSILDNDPWYIDDDIPTQEQWNRFDYWSYHYGSGELFPDIPSSYFESGDYRWFENPYEYPFGIRQWIIRRRTIERIPVSIRDSVRDPTTNAEGRVAAAVAYLASLQADALDENGLTHTQRFRAKHPERWAV